jgi:NAD-dependent deacetylase
VDHIADAVKALSGCSSILVFTGAGISTESGIPDFRGPGGVWTRVDPEEFTYSRYLSNPDTRRRGWAMRAESGVFDATPNAAHRAIAELWDGGLMIACVTQNIDGLHQVAGLPDEAVIELHGNAHHTTCVSCGSRQPTAVVLDRVAGGEDDPTCTDCGGILKPDVVFFGEMMPEREMMRAAMAAGEADAVIAVGSTLSVFPAANVPLEVAEAGHPFVIVNRGPTELDDIATVRIEGPAGDLLPGIVRRLISGAA